MKKKPSVVSPSPTTSSPRPRKRSGRAIVHKPQEEYRGTFALREDDLGQFRDRSYSGFAPRVRGAKIRNSKRWIDGISQPLTELSFPFINKLGQFTGTTLFKWSCDPRSFIASTVSTILSRLMNRCKHYNSMNLVDKNAERLLRVATYYSFTKNKWFWDRVLFFTKNLEKYGKQLHTVMLRMLSKTDANKRFVYGHVCSQTQWLLFRAERPRDKSAVEKRCGATTPNREFASRLEIGGHLADIALAISNL